MRVYICCDMEGVGGIVDAEQTMPDGKDYEWSRKLLTNEVNAAVTGALAAGATHVTVNDAHNTMRNIKPSDLHPGAFLISGKAKPLSMMEGIEDGFDCAMFIGYHSRIGEPRGVLGHSYNPGSVIQELRINGRVVGETSLNGYVAGHFGVPIVLVSGDEAACSEARVTFPGCLAVTTKQGRGKFSAKGPHPDICCSAIEQAAREAVGRFSSARAVIPEMPVEIKLRLASSAMADIACLVPQIMRVDETTIAWVSSDYLSCYKMFLVATCMTRAATDRVY